MGRAAELAVFAAVLLLYPFCCQADLKVATCSLANKLEMSTQNLQEQVDSLANETEQRLEDQGEEVKVLLQDVDFLQGKTGFQFLSRLVATVQLDRSLPFETRPFCEIYTYSEAVEFARYIIRGQFIENPNPHWVHIPCNPETCPKTFWKIRQGCYQPNGPMREGDVSPMQSCFYDPIPLNETCSRYVYIGPFGYSDNLLFRFWNHTFDPSNLSQGVVAMPLEG